MRSIKDVAVCAVFIAFIGVLCVFNLVSDKPDVLITERRVPASFPNFDVKSVTTGSFMSGFEDYAADNFAFRDAFRAIRAFTVFEVFRQSDKSGLYLDAAVGAGEFKRTDSDAFARTARKILAAADAMAGVGMDVRYCVIPDKSVFAAEYMPGYDSSAADAVISGILGDYENISIDAVLGADSFYRTDLHWSQDKIIPVAQAILDAYGADAPEIRVIPQPRSPRSYGEFFGVYAGRLALPIEADRLLCVDPPPALSVNYLDAETTEFVKGPVYDVDRLSGVDPYDFFLRGPQPLILLENPEATYPERELYMFRDSFGSSLAPILSYAYARITLVDLRYLNLSLLDDFVGLTSGADALFIYSSQIYGNPSVLQVE